VNVPVKLGIFEHSDVSNEKGCVPANIGLTRKVGAREFTLCTTILDLTVGLPVAGDISNQLIDAANGVKSTDLPAIGATRIHLDEASFVATTQDLYAGGYLAVYGGTGLGYTYGIKANSAFFNTDEIYVDIYDGLVLALAATSDIEILLLKEENVGIADSGAVERNVGVCTHAIPAATDITAGTTSAVGYYFWAQTAGPILVNPDASNTAGKLVMVHTDVGELDDETAGFLTMGQTIEVGSASTISSLIDLKVQ